ncbi:MAG: cysteine desulfurase [Rhodothermales bacterium]|jgi:cysteine desulfurase
MANPIYLDYNATTPVDPDVVDAMLPYFGVHYGNPSSKRHAFGWTADEAVTIARERLGALVEANPDWVHFTGGATEAINWCIKGYAATNQGKGRHLIAVATEHKAVLGSCQAMEKLGWDVTVLGVDRNGRADPAELAAAIREETVLVCCMWANNELGAIHPVAEITEIAHARGVAVLVDATQAVGKVQVSVGDIDFLACSAHKFYGPKGVGALIINGSRPRLRLEPLIHGGGQEFGKRAGTSNVPGIVGLGAAAEKARRLLDGEAAHLAKLRDQLEDGIRAMGAEMIVNGANGPRLPNTSNVTFPGVDTARLLERIPGLAVSTGSACSTGSGSPSHVLSAIDSDLDSATLRLSLGRFSTIQEVSAAAEQIGRAAAELQLVSQEN